MEEAYKKAVEGGYMVEESKLLKDIFGEKYLSRYTIYSCLLDLEFWKCLGKNLGWAINDEPYLCKDCGVIGISDYNHMHDCPTKNRKLSWLTYWLDFIRHLSKGGDIDLFFTNLISLK